MKKAKRNQRDPGPPDYEPLRDQFVLDVFAWHHVRKDVICQAQLLRTAALLEYRTSREAKPRLDSGIGLFAKLQPLVRRYSEILPEAAGYWWRYASPVVIRDGGDPEEVQVVERHVPPNPADYQEFDGLGAEVVDVLVESKLVAVNGGCGVLTPPETLVGLVIASVLPALADGDPLLERAGLLGRLLTRDAMGRNPWHLSLPNWERNQSSGEFRQFVMRKFRVALANHIERQSKLRDEIQSANWGGRSNRHESRKERFPRRYFAWFALFQMGGWRGTDIARHLAKMGMDISISDPKPVTRAYEIVANATGICLRTRKPKASLRLS